MFNWLVCSGITWTIHQYTDQYNNEIIISPQKSPENNLLLIGKGSLSVDINTHLSVFYIGVFATYINQKDNLLRRHIQSYILQERSWNWDFSIFSISCIFMITLILAFILSKKKNKAISVVNCLGSIIDLYYIYGNI